MPTAPTTPLEQILGPEEATTLMEHLPPVGLADVATKHDLAHLEQRMDRRFAETASRIDALGANLRADQRRHQRASTPKSVNMVWLVTRE